jgi:type I restriction enzyme M protein
MASKTHESEVESYAYIRDRLKALGWDIKNPSRSETGQVWTQTQCLADSEIKQWLGAKHPENIVKVNESVLWVIEAKPSHTELKYAYFEAIERANTIRPSKKYQVLFVSGVAGNDIDSYIVTNGFYDGKQFVPITMNGVATTGLLSQQQLQAVLSRGRADIAEPVIDEKLFRDTAQRISGILHLGAIPPHRRAGDMAALLLSMLCDTPPNIESRDASVLVNDINGRVQMELKRQGKLEFYDHIKIALPAAGENHMKLRKALVATLQELNNLNIRSAMNSGADWLGMFYEVFLKYANWAQKLGIVLTPRHLTPFIADVMDIQVSDIVYDPTCGTGGFLVAAFDSLKQKANPTQLTRFKQNGVFGVEQEDGIAALAVVNMIFRGDGKNNIKAGDCFQTFLTSSISHGIPTAAFVSEPVDNPPVSKVMMNPPFALKRGAHKEFEFIDQALKQVQHGGLLFSVLPYGIMVRPSVYRAWRQHTLLAQNTLLAVMTFPPDIFYPVGVQTLGVFVKKGSPHPKDQNVLWLRAVNDGLVKSKGRRLPSPRTSNDLVAIKDLLKAFLRNTEHPIPSVHQSHKVTPVDFTDPQLELVPEAYLDQSCPKENEIGEGLERGIRNTLAYLIKINKAVIEPRLVARVHRMVTPPADWGIFTIAELFDLKRGNFHSIANLDPGQYPTISRISTDCGFVGFYDKPVRAKVWPEGTITVSTVTGDAFVQPIPFIATDNVVLCIPNQEYKDIRLTTLFFIGQMLDFVKWRYSYGRQCYKTKFAKTQIWLPIMQTGQIDESYMAVLVENTAYWPLVRGVFRKEIRRQDAP